MKLLSKALLGVVLVFSMPSLHAVAGENNYIAVIGSGRAQQWPDYAVVIASVLKELITGTRDHHALHNEESAPLFVLVTPQAVSVNVTLYVKYAMQ